MVQSSDMNEVVPQVTQNPTTVPQLNMMMQEKGKTKLTLLQATVFTQFPQVVWWWYFTRAVTLR